MDVILALLIAAAGGALGGLLGVGGGVVFVPALALLLGHDQLTAEATSLLVIVPMAVIGTWRQHRHGNVDLRAGILIGALSLPGVLVGVTVANEVSERALELSFAGLAIFIALQLLRRGLVPTPEPPAPTPD